MVFYSAFFYQEARELYGGVKMGNFCEWESCENLILYLYCKYMTGKSVQQQRFITVFLIEIIFKIEIPDLTKNLLLS